MQQGFIVVMMTCSSEEEAKKITNIVIGEKLAACVQTSQINSTYRWENEVVTDPEIRLLMKTKANLFEQISTAIKNNSSYQNPEIISLPILQGTTEYLDWIRQEVE